MGDLPHVSEGDYVAATWSRAEYVNAVVDVVNAARALCVAAEASWAAEDEAEWSQAIKAQGRAMAHLWSMVGQHYAIEYRCRPEGQSSEERRHGA